MRLACAERDHVSDNERVANFCVMCDAFALVVVHSEASSMRSNDQQKQAIRPLGRFSASLTQYLQILQATVM